MSTEPELQVGPKSLRGRPGQVSKQLPAAPEAWPGHSSECFLSHDGQKEVSEAKVGILVASLASAVAGFLILHKQLRKAATTTD